MKKLIILFLLSLCNFIIYSSEKKIIKKDPFSFEKKQSRSLISRIKLLECYKKHSYPSFNKKELENLQKILTKKIADELTLFQSYPSPESKKFLFLAQKNNYLTPEQNELFTTIVKQKEKQTRRFLAHENTTATTYYQLVLLILLLLIQQVG